jgi:DNA polymerase III subunit gamma/tau
MRPPPAPVRWGTELVIRPYRALATTAVFAAFFVAGNALGEDEQAAPAPVAAKTSAVALAPLRLEPTPGLPDLRAERAERRRSRRATPPKPAAGGPSVAAEPEASGATSPGPVAESPPVYTPSVEPQPQTPPSATPPPVQSTPETPEAPAPDPAPAPAPAPSPDPSPGGGG